MSRDIRSYFSAGPSKKVKHEDKAEKGRVASGTHKKKRAVIESDSEEEIFIPKKKSNTESHSKVTSKEKQKAAERPSVNAADIFGSGPVQRTARKVASRENEVHDDPAFEEVLKNLDESELFGSDVTKTGSESKAASGTNIKKQSPDKPEKKVSPAKPENAKTQGGQEKRSHSSKRDEGKDVTEKDVRKREVSSLSQRDSSGSRVEKKSKINLASGSESRSESKSEKRSESKPESRSESRSDSKSESRSDCKLENKAEHSSMKRKTPEKSSGDVTSTKLSKVDIPMMKPSEPSEMWVDKYKPTSVKQIIGQQGDNSNVRKLLHWLSNWHSNHGPGVEKKHVRPSPWSKDDSGAFFKAALLSGPPGVGKTTTAHLVCKELGMDVVEFNASDTRSKKLMNQEVTVLLTNESLNPYFQSGGVSKTSSKHVLVMDEVDGMAGNEDRGGVQELINLIKNSKCPVICMCNDRNHPKIRSLANYCFDLRFYKPRVEQIRGAMMSVCFKEKVQITPEALNEVIAGTNCDIRQVLHNLSMWCSGDKKLSADQARVDANGAKKNIKLGPFDALKKVFSAEDHKSMSLMDKSDLFFHDYNIMPLFVQENYLNSSPHSVKKSTEVLKHIARAATSISYGDLIEKNIRSRMAWSLLPVQAMYSSVVPGELMEGHLTAQIQFPAWLGKNSKRNKMDRLLQELQTHMRLSISGGKQAVNLDYLPYVQNAIVHPLVAEGAAGVSKTLEAMQDYYLTREDLDSLLELCQWPGQPDPMSKVESKVKAALTRAYNKGGVMIPYALEAPIKKRVGSVAPDDELAGLEEDAVPDADSGSEDEDGLDAMIKAKKPDKKASSAGSDAASTSRGRGRGGGRGAGTSSARGRGRGKAK